MPTPPQDTSRMRDEVPYVEPAPLRLFPIAPPQPFVPFPRPAPKLPKMRKQPIEKIKDWREVTYTWSPVNMHDVGYIPPKTEIKLPTSQTPARIPGKGCVTVEEARVRAFLRMLRVGEATVGEKGYETNVGGRSFIKYYKKDWHTHPRVHVQLTPKLKSDAAGAYQIMGNTWDDIAALRKKYHIADFSPESQDLMALLILKYKRRTPLSEKAIKRLGEKFRHAYGDIVEYIKKGDIDKAILIASLEWASLPGSPYNQRTETYESVKKYYNEYLKQELNCISDLHLRPGFLSQIE
jgi:muramidase (phage lysozyme)